MQPTTVKPTKVTKSNLVRRIKGAGFDSVTAYAQRKHVTRQAIYFALEMPFRFRALYKSIQEDLS